MVNLFTDMDKELKRLIKQGESYNLEFKESLDKSISKEMCAFANTNGGKILLGVKDNGEIKGINITNKLKSEIQSHARNIKPPVKINVSDIDNVIIIDVLDSKDTPHSASGQFFLREGATSQKLERDEVKELFIREGLLRFDDTPNKDFDLSKDLDKNKFNLFLDKANISKVLKRGQILENLKLLEKGKLRNAGVLLFCHRIGKFFLNATIDCVLYQGEDKYKILDRKEFNADLHSNYQNALTYLKNRLKTEYIIKGGPREEKLEIPEDALREAILNAIAHRDYFSTAHIQVDIYPNRVEIINPGGLIGNLTLKELYKKSIPRNPLLFGLMQRMELAERSGSGLLRIDKAMKEYKLGKPKIEVNKHFFSITFIRPKESYEERVEGKKFGEKLGDWS